jgi:hypothetical protein
VKTLRRACPIALIGIALLAVPADAAPAPAAIWHMDEASGSVMHDSSGHGNDGANKNIQLGVPGSAGSGYRFNGTSSRVIVPSSASLNPGSADIAITVHFATTALPADDYDLIRKGLQTTSGGDYKIEIVNVDGVAKARCFFRGSKGSYQKTVAVPNLLNGAYHTITCRKTATQVITTVDAQSWTHTGAIGSISNTAEVIVGAKSSAASSADWYKGSLDEIRIDIGS